MRELTNPDESKQICSLHLKKGSFCFKQMEQESSVNDQQKEAHKNALFPLPEADNAETCKFMMDYIKVRVLNSRTLGHF